MCFSFFFQESSDCMLYEANDLRRWGNDDEDGGY